MARISFIIPPNPQMLDDRVDPHLGALYMCAVLREAGHEVRYCDLQGRPEAAWRIPESDIYGITVYSATLQHARRLAAMCKRVSPGALVVVGGPHVSALPEATLALEPLFDCAVIGEGELAMLEVVRTRGKDRFYRRPVQDLDALPPPARDLADLGSYSRTVAGKPSVSLMTQRGCAFNCHFCANDRLLGPVRQRALPKVMAELENLVGTYGRRNFYFYDNIISFNAERYARFLGSVRGMGLEWFAYDDCRNAYPEAEYRKWYDSGCRVVFLGVETAAPGLLKMMTKEISPERVRATVRNMQAAGIEARCGLLFGYPGETRETWAATKRFIDELQPAQVLINYFVPFPGTGVYERPGEFGVSDVSQDFSAYTSLNKDCAFHPVFSSRYMTRAEYAALAADAVSWWRGYTAGHSTRFAPAWTPRFMETGSGGRTS